MSDMPDAFTGSEPTDGESRDGDGGVRPVPPGVGEPQTDGGSKDVSHRVSESADKIELRTKVKRGTGTRDQDVVVVKVKGDDPEASAGKLARTLDALEAAGVVDTLRETQADN